MPSLADMLLVRYLMLATDGVASTFRAMDHQVPHRAALLGTPLGGGMMQEKVQLYREGYISQTTINVLTSKSEGVTEDGGGHTPAGGVTESVHGSLSCELPEGGQVHLYTNIIIIFY